MHQIFQRMSVNRDSGNATSEAHQSLINRPENITATTRRSRPEPQGFEKFSKINQLPYSHADSGDHSAMEPPGPIPNPEVKRCSADGSGTIGPVRVGRRQVYLPSILLTQSAGHFFCPVSKECEDTSHPGITPNHARREHKVPRRHGGTWIDEAQVVARK